MSAPERVLSLVIIRNMFTIWQHNQTLICGLNLRYFYQAGKFCSNRSIAEHLSEHFQRHIHFVFGTVYLPFAIWVLGIRNAKVMRLMMVLSISIAYS